MAEKQMPRDTAWGKGKEWLVKRVLKRENVAITLVCVLMPQQAILPTGFNILDVQHFYRGMDIP